MQRLHDGLHAAPATVASFAAFRRTSMHLRANVASA
jgi:hypothetical protein